MKSKKTISKDTSVKNSIDESATSNSAKLVAVNPRLRINKYLADEQYASRRGADELIRQGRVYINGRVAVLGDTVKQGDVVEVRSLGRATADAKAGANSAKGRAGANNTDGANGANNNAPELVYFAYNKPIGVLTHSAQDEEIDIQGMLGKMSDRTFLKNVAGGKLFPVGRLDKDSHGLIIMTNDGRITGKLLDPEEKHEKEYVVETKKRLTDNFSTRMEKGVVIEDGNGKRFKTKPCVVTITGDKKFSIILTEGKKRQIRRMCEVLGNEVVDLKRTRIMSIELGRTPENSLRKIKGEELQIFMKELGVRML